MLKFVVEVGESQSLRLFLGFVFAFMAFSKRSLILACDYIYIAI